MPNIPFCTPSKNQKTFDVFWCFQEVSSGSISLEVEGEPALPSSLFLDFLYKYLLLSDSRMRLYTDLLSSFICDKSIQEWAKWNLWKTAFKKFKCDLLKNTLSHMFGDMSLILNHTPNLQWFVRTFSLAGHHSSDYVTISDPDVEVLIYSEVVFSTVSLPVYHMWCFARFGTICTI